jgi:hypothetical protein
MRKIKRKVKETSGLKGKLTITVADIVTPAQKALAATIAKLRAEGLPFMHLVRQLNSMCRVRRFAYNNVTCTVYRALIMENASDPTPSADILVKYAALGSNTTAPTIGDTTLGTETYRNVIASRTNANHVGYFSAYFDLTEVSGTFKEAGLFAGAATGSANSGTLVSHVAIDVTKTLTQTLTIDWTLTLNNG